MVRTSITSGRRTTTNGIFVTSYITGKSLGRFRNEKELFKKHPKEKEALNRVERFNLMNKTKFTTIMQLPERQQFRGKQEVVERIFADRQIKR